MTETPIEKYLNVIVTFYAQKSGEAVIPIEYLSILDRLMNALSAYLIYLRNMLWPHNLAPLYPLPDTPSIGTAAVGTALIALVTLAVFYLRKKQPYLLTGWLWYLGMLVPVIGLVQVGIQSHADRYTYLPMIGCSVAAVWYLHGISAKWSQGHNTLIIIAVVLVLLFAIQTRLQVLLWRNNETLFRHTLAVTSNNYVIHMTLGSELWDQGRRDEAIAEYRKAIKITPKYPDHYFFLATALLLEGRTEEAVKEYRTILELRPDFPFAHTNLGMALQKLGRNEEAIVEYREGLRLVPNDYKAKENLQLLLRKHGRNYLDFPS
jgi:tetratricopeptide (TPR) repeat protein